MNKSTGNSVVPSVILDDDMDYTILETSAKYSYSPLYSVLDPLMHIEDLRDPILMHLQND